MAELLQTSVDMTRTTTGVIKFLKKALRMTATMNGIQQR